MRALMYALFVLGGITIWAGVLIATTGAQIARPLVLTGLAAIIGGTVIDAWRRG